jgi:hypothetical protein
LPIEFDLGFSKEKHNASIFRHLSPSKNNQSKEVLSQATEIPLIPDTFQALLTAQLLLSTKKEQ